MPVHSCQILMKVEFSPQILEKYSNTKSNENASSGNGVVPCGSLVRDRQIYMTSYLSPFAILRTPLKTSVYSICACFY